MKEYIEYYYDMKNIILYRSNDKYRFTYDNVEYYFETVKRNVFEINEIYSCIRLNDEIDKIVKNVYGQLVTRINSGEYILIKKTTVKVDLLYSVMKMHSEYNVVDFYNRIDHSNWIQLWSKKIDNMEFQLEHLDGKYSILNQFVNYYIGMGECAISYINNLKSSIGYDSLRDDKKIISHLRIFEQDFNSPQNIIIDYRSRDIAEYLKFVFLNGIYNFSQLEKILLILDYGTNSPEFVYARLFFPTFFFDLYDQIINSEVQEEEILKLTNRVNEYEMFVNNIFLIINRQKKIPKISWD